MARIGTGLGKLFNGTTYHPTGKAAIHEALTELLIETLLPAFESLRELRAIIADDSVPLVKENKSFDVMYRTIWTVYKDPLQKAARLMGYNIGFLFKP